MEKNCKKENQKKIVRTPFGIIELKGTMPIYWGVYNWINNVKM